MTAPYKKKDWKREWIPTLLDLCSAIYDDCQRLENLCKDMNKKADYLIDQAKDIHFSMRVFEDGFLERYKDSANEKDDETTNTEA